MRRWVMGLAMAGLALAPSDARAQATDPAVMTAERFVRLLREAKWDSAGAMVARSVPAGRLGAAQLQTLWGQLGGQLGALSSVRLHAVTPADSLRAVELYADFANQDVLIRVVVSAQSEVAGLWVGPAPATAPAAAASAPYVDRAKFREQEVVVGSSPWELPGTLTVPIAAGPHPVVVLVHGSGPNDRDETVGPNKPFRDLAWGLASQGIAVLRYEKRTRQHGMTYPTNATVEQETIEDALLALRLARRTAGVDSSRVYLLGHSLGGLVGPEIAQRDGRLAGLILLAAPARDMAAVVMDQLTYLATLPINAAAASQAQLRTFQEQVKALQAGTAADTALVMGAPVGYWRDLMRRRPVEVARGLRIPLLVLHGARDYQVPEREHQLWVSGMAERANVTVALFPGLNHLFMTGTGQPTPAEYAQPGHVAPEVLDAIVRWVRR
jgi:dienelactone hydrolase